MVAPAALSVRLRLLLRPQLGRVVQRPHAEFGGDISGEFCEAEQKPRRPEG